MQAQKQKSNDPSDTDLVKLAREWTVKMASKVTGQVTTVVLLRPKTTAAIGLALALGAAALCWTGKAVGEYREKRHNEWRLRQMTDAVRQADQRVRSQMTSTYEEPAAEFRGVFETMRDRTEQPTVTEESPVSGSKP